MCKCLFSWGFLLVLLLIIVVFFNKYFSSDNFIQPNIKISGLLLSPSGDHLLISSADTTSIVVYQYSNGNLTNPQKYYLPNITSPFIQQCVSNNMKFSNNGQYLFVTCNHGLAIMKWDSNSGILLPLDYYTPDLFVCSLDKSCSIDTISNDSMIAIGTDSRIYTYSFNLKSGKASLMETHEFNVPRYFSSLLFSPDNQYLYTGSKKLGYLGCQIILHKLNHSSGYLEVITGRDYYCPKGGGYISDLKLSPCKKYLYMINFMQMVVYKIELNGDINHHSTVETFSNGKIIFSPDGKTAVIGNNLYTHITALNCSGIDNICSQPVKVFPWLPEVQYIQYDKTGSYLYVGSSGISSILRLNIKRAFETYQEYFINDFYLPFISLFGLK